MDKVKEAFYKVKKDIDSLYKEVDSIKEILKITRQEMINICEILKNVNKNIEEISLEKTKKPLETLFVQSKPLPAQGYPKQTSSTHPSTHDSSLEPLKHQNKAFSTGNQGVPTDRQTDRQTDIQHTFSLKQPPNLDRTASLDSIDNAAKILDSLDSIKKEIRLKFKRLTDQELLVFSTLYQLDEEEGYTEYKTLANKLNLTESSIRDYVGRLIKKGIPVEKKRINNKIIHLSISKNLKKIASLSTILQLRDL